MKSLIYFLFLSISGFSQINYPTDYFRLPLDIPMELSGCFGELRNNHFHSGFDIKTNKQEGLNVFAVADGYVSRIKISTFGYGKAIYITHPNGFTTLYGHLKSGVGSIEKFIKTNQYQQKSYEIELFLKPDDLPVKKGDIIALSGNTGGSGGPHLHFEFRDSKNDNIINPMLFGFDTYLKDTKKPTINSLLVYPIDDQSVVNESNKPVTINLVLQPDGSYIAQKIKVFGKIGFGISAFDTFDNVYNKYGLYKVSVSKNEKSIFEYQFDSFAFEEFRYINALLDYPRFKSMNQKVQKLFMKNPYPLKIIKTDAANGIIEVEKNNMTQVYKIQIYDFKNNHIEILVPVDYSDLLAKNIEPIKKTKYFVKSNNENIFSLENVEINFPEKVFYNDFYMDLKVKNDTVFLHNESVPVHSNFTLMIDSKNNSEIQMSKMFIGKLENKKIEFVQTTRKGSVFTARNRELGVYCLSKDTIAPKITSLKPIEGKNLTKEKNITIKISDDLSGIKSFNGYINGNWVLMEYEYKLKRLTYNLQDNKLKIGINDFKLEVIDNLGNSSIFETWFEYSETINED
ncbi:MAG: M23 family metallopeptidase [Flavobacterium sp.]|nr:M23 family metallopeptidase [Flavobacterium sp.]